MNPSHLGLRIEEVPVTTQHCIVEAASGESRRVRLRIPFIVSEPNSDALEGIIRAKALPAGATANRRRVLVEHDETRVAGLDEWLLRYHKYLQEPGYFHRKIFNSLLA